MAAKKAKPKGKRGTGRTNRARTAPDWADKFFEALRTEGTIYHACKKVGVGRRTVYERRDRDPEFAAAFADAKEDGVDVLEREAIHRGCEGYLEPVVHQGRIMGDWVNEAGEQVMPDAPGARFVPVAVRKFSDTLLANLLKWKRYGDALNVQHTGPEGGPVQFISVPSESAATSPADEPPFIEVADAADAGPAAGPAGDP